VDQEDGRPVQIVEAAFVGEGEYPGEAGRRAVVLDMGDLLSQEPVGTKRRGSDLVLAMEVSASEDNVTQGSAE
jgi:hypothetical protein